MRELRISFCTTCMNRLLHLKETLPTNLSNNKSYKNLEFVLLDYNSRDELEQYISEHFSNYIKNGRLVYYKTRSPKFYNMSHSRNVAFKLATGDVICNLDADNFTGYGFAEYINKIFNKNTYCFLTSQGGQNISRDVLGRICVKKKDFMLIGGYEEQMRHYGFDDVDLVNRLLRFGLEKNIIDNSRYLKAIQHSTFERLNNWDEMQRLKCILYRQIDPSMTELFILLGGGEYKRATLVNNHIRNVLNNLGINDIKYKYSIDEVNFITGRWKNHAEFLELDYGSEIEILKYFKHGSYLMSMTKNLKFRILKNKRLVEDIMLFFNQISNRIVLEDNINTNKIITNERGFGEDVVYRNFDGKPISI